MYVNETLNIVVCIVGISREDFWVVDFSTVWCCTSISMRSCVFLLICYGLPLYFVTGFPYTYVTPFSVFLSVRIAQEVVPVICRCQKEY